MSLTPDQTKQLQQAILSSFPSESALEQALFFGLGERLSDNVGPGPLARRVFDLITWADANNKVLALVAALRSQNSGNPLLARIEVSLKVEINLSPGPPPPPPPPPPTSALVQPWFLDLPINWARPETQTVFAGLRAAYTTHWDVLALARDAGLDVGSLSQMAPVNQLLREVIERARLANRLVPLLVLVFEDDQKQAVHEVIRSTILGWEADFSAAALRSRNPTFSVLARIPPAAEILGMSGPETLLNVAAGFADPAVFREWLAQAEARVAQVLVNGNAAGTAFLVGDSLLLTNWHVVKGLAKEDEGAAVFDYKRLPNGRVAYQRVVKFATDWRVTYSEDADEAAERSEHGPPADRLDYALVRLAEPVGAQGIGENRAGDARRHFDLPSDRREFLNAEPLLVLGHPQGRPLQLSYASPAQAKRTSTEVRVRYQTNTDNGSSGSPVLDRNWKLVALHNFGGSTRNQGIPTDCIATDLARKLEANRPLLAELGLQ